MLGAHLVSNNASCKGFAFIAYGYLVLPTHTTQTLKCLPAPFPEARLLKNTWDAGGSLNLFMDGKTFLCPVPAIWCYLYFFQYLRPSGGNSV